MRIIVTRAVPEASLELLRRDLPDAEIWVNPNPAPIERETLLVEAHKGCDALLCTLGDRLDAETLEELGPDCRVIATYAVGTNNIDLEHAASLQIAVANTPEVLTDASAEIAVALMLAVARRLIEGDEMVRKDRFTGWAPLLHLGRGVYGKTIGIFGAGRIGQRVGKTMALGFGCQVIYCSRSRKPKFEASCGAQRVDFDQLLAQSDFLSLHAPLNEDTYHLINTERLEQMQPSAYLINTARGPMVDEEALVEALQRGTIAGAGLDVFEDEPALARGLISLPNVVLLPHIGSATFATRAAMGQLCAEAIIDVLKHQKAPKHLANTWQPAR